MNLFFVSISDYVMKCLMRSINRCVIGRYSQ